LVRLYRHSEQFRQGEAGQAVFGFFIHALPHLNAAGRLLLGEISDPFASLCQSHTGKR
jgi:hypothetical protein